MGSGFRSSSEVLPEFFSGLTPGFVGLAALVFGFQVGEELAQFFFETGQVNHGIGGNVSFVSFGGRAGGQGLIHQGLMQNGDDPGAGGEQAVVGGRAGGVNQAVGGIQFQGQIRFIDLVNDAAADVGAFIDPVGVFGGGGRLHPFFHLAQEGVEFYKGDLFAVVLQAHHSPSHFFLQVPAVSVEGGAAGAEFVTELVQGVILGEDGQVDVVEEWMIANGASGIHGFLRLRTANRE